MSFTGGHLVMFLLEGVPSAAERSLLDKFGDTGLAVMIIFFIGMLIWKIFPITIEWLRASAVQHRALASAIPDIQESLKKIADSQSILVNLDRKMDLLVSGINELLTKKLDTIAVGVSELLTRIPDPNKKS